MQFFNRNNNNKIGTAFTVNDDALANKIDNAIAANSTDKYTSVFDTSSTNNFEMKVPDSLVNPTISGLGNKSQVDLTNNNGMFTSKADNSKKKYASVFDTSSTSNFGIRMPENLTNTSFNGLEMKSSIDYLTNNKNNDIFASVTDSFKNDEQDVIDNSGQQTTLTNCNVPSPTITEGNNIKYGAKPWNKIGFISNDSLYNSFLNNEDNKIDTTKVIENNNQRNNRYNIQNAIKYLKNNAEPYYIADKCGNCAKAVRLAIEAGGLSTLGHPESAKDYDSFLPTIGFSKVDSNLYIPQMGDIVVHQAQDKHKHGHIAMYDGLKWVSDFIQNDMYGGSAYRGNPNFTIWRTN